MASLNYLGDQDYNAAGQQGLGNQDKGLDQEEHYWAVHIVSLDIHHKFREGLVVPLDHNVHREVDRHRVAFVGWNQASLLHTSSDAEAGPFLPKVQNLVNVQDNHAQAHRDH